MAEEVNLGNKLNSPVESSTNGWDSLSSVDFAGDNIESLEADTAPKFRDPEEMKMRTAQAPFVVIGAETSQFGNKVVDVDGFLESQPMARRRQMIDERISLEGKRLRLRPNLVSENQPEPYDEYLRQKSDLIRQHLDEPDCVEYLMSVTNEPIEVVMSGMFMVDPGRTLDHFDHTSELLRDEFGDKSDQATYNILQYATMGKNSLKMNDFDKTLETPSHIKLGYEGIFRLPSARDQRQLMELAKRKDLKVDTYMSDEYVRTAANSEHELDREQLFDDLDLFGEQGITPERVMKNLCKAGEHMTIARHTEDFSRHGIEAVRSIWAFLQDIQERPRGAAFVYLNNPQAYQRFRIPVKQVVENNLPRVRDWEANLTGKQRRNLEVLGIDMNQLRRDGEDWDAEKDVGYQREFRGEFVDAYDLPEQVRDEWRDSLDALVLHEDGKAIKEKMRAFAPENWQKMDGEERAQAIEGYASVLAKNYNLHQPYEIRYVSGESSNSGMGDSVYGEQHNEYRLARDPEMQEYSEKMRAVGINATWLPKSVVSLNTDYFDEGMHLAGTIAHELRHAYQSEQAFLWKQGYEAESHPDSVFDFFPVLARYFAGNLQSDCYRKAEDSYSEYRNQLIEYDAFLVGDFYKDTLKDVAKEEEMRDVERIVQEYYQREAKLRSENGGN